jgi:hypothetical protein
MNIWELFTGLGKSDDDNSNVSNELLAEGCDVKFVSPKQVRYQHDQYMAETDDTTYRGVRIEGLANDVYRVSIYMMEGSHPVWGGNTTMAPKLMRIEERKPSQMVFRGINGASPFDDFSDYGITIEKHDATIDKIILHMYDRSTDIAYLSETESKKKVSKKREKDEEYRKLFILTQHMIHEAEDRDGLRDAMEAAKRLQSPYIDAKLGEKYKSFSLDYLANICWVQGMKSATADADYIEDRMLALGVGMCISNYFTHFTVSDPNIAFNTTKIGYFLLSIAAGVHQLEEGLQYRGQLLTGHEIPLVVQSLIANKAGVGMRLEAYFISDYYYAAIKSDPVHQSMLDHAANIHRWLEDTTFAGRGADDYSLEEFAALGARRHMELFDTLREEDKDETYFISSEEISELMA